jgi:putative hydrolase
VHDYLDTVEVRIESGAAGGLPSLPDLGQLVDAFREGGLAALVQTREQRSLLNRIQASMAVVEGYSEHVMDALGVRLLRAYSGLRDAMVRRRRSRSAPERIIERLLGLDFKLRQYELGKEFCDRVAAEGGIETLNRVWESPQALPSLRELSAPGEWLERTGRSAPAPLA